MVKPLTIAWEMVIMVEITKTMKLHIHPDKKAQEMLKELTVHYRDACEFISGYVFDHDFPLNFMSLQNRLYQTVRSQFGLKAQITISAFKTVTARYKTVKEQLASKPYGYKDADGNWQKIPRTLEWLCDQIHFRRPQADLVRGRDYSFVKDRKSGKTLLSLNTLENRIHVSYDVPDCYAGYFDGTWSFGTGKVVSLKGDWYFHIPVTKADPAGFDAGRAKHVVGIDRGLRFLAVTYDEKGKTDFTDGTAVMEKRERFQQVRSELQSKGTRSAKRALKRISGRENRWMSDVNHQISKTLVGRYGEGALFVIEDLTNVSFDNGSLSRKSKDGRRQLRSWPFYQFEQFLTYKAHANGSEVLKVNAAYTSQRCPKCGRIRKENRNHDIHEYHCDCCGYRSNDDRIGAMNIQTLGTLYISGDINPRFGPRKVN